MRPQLIQMRPHLIQRARCARNPRGPLRGAGGSVGARGVAILPSSTQVDAEAGAAAAARGEIGEPGRDGRVSNAGRGLAPRRGRRGDARRRAGVFSGVARPFPIRRREADARSLRGETARASLRATRPSTSRPREPRARDPALAPDAIVACARRTERCATFSDCCLCSRSLRRSGSRRGRRLRKPQTRPARRGVGVWSDLRCGRRLRGPVRLRDEPGGARGAR